MREDLQKSGLTPQDLDARPLEDPERAMAHIPPAIEGYVIPYRDIDGNLLPFYRVRQFDSQPKYKALRDSVNHVYFPKGFKKAVETSQRDYILITEGEKKAVAATKAGFPTVALSGVDSWRTRTIILPEGTELSAARVPGGRQGLVKAKLPAKAETTIGTTLAEGMADLIDFLVETRLKVVICYDSDNGGTSYDVQRAASALAFEFRHRGIPFSHIRQVILPPIPGQSGKVGLDDYLLHCSAAGLDLVCTTAINRRTAFPRHPNIREFINKQLQNPRLDRKAVQGVGLAVLADMDSRGKRLRSVSDDQLYYFDDRSRRLIKVQLASSGREIMNDTEFYRHLYREYGLSVADQRLMQWFAAQFSAEQPIERVQPYRVFARTGEDSVAFQINDGQYALVDGSGVDILDNGSGGVLFEAEATEEIDASDLLQAYNRLEKTRPENWWLDILGHVRLKPDPRLAQAVSLLYYISPWLYRWRGTQLPIELVLGESGSGKSSLYELRLQIILGYPQLRNAPTDIKDWHASVASAGGLHVTDNVQLVDKNLRQRLSDELCRLVTEPDPHVEMRKLYSNAELIRVPVTTTFAMTAIQQPFINADVLQRSTIIELDKSQASGPTPETPLTFDSSWARHMLELHGSRTDWIAHHLLVLHLFFKLVKKKWSTNYAARHRLINLEQAYILMAEVFDVPSDWIPAYLSGRTDKAISESDWALEGLIRFAQLIRLKGKNCDKERFTAQDIANWGQNDDDYTECYQLTNPRRLGRYLQAHKSMVQTMTGITEATKMHNRMSYKIAIKI